MTGIYVASKVKHGGLWRAFRDERGVPIVSTWIDYNELKMPEDLRDLWQRCVKEAENSIAMLLYREPGEVLKGAWIELGVALANNVPVYAVGIEEYTVSHAEGVRHFANLESALSELLLDVAYESLKRNNK